MRTVTSFPRDIVCHEDVGIVMPDGIRLSARLWLPVDARENPVPAIVEHLPYRKRDGTTARDQLTHPWLAGHGYACLRIDMRGNGDSQGIMTDEYTAQELQDACDVIAWVASQPWCTGKVGMMGISWGGFNALQVAALAPPALAAIITLCSTDDRYGDDIHYKGGLLLHENLGWGATMLSFSSRPPDPALVGEAWRDMWIQRLEANPLLHARWMEHPTRDAYWKHGSVCENWSAIGAKVLAVGGWGDAYKNSVSRIVTNVPGAKGIIGPWIHKYPHFARPNPIGFLQEALRWWDRWLKDRDTGADADPAMRIFVQESERPLPWYDSRRGNWIAESVWPSPAIAERAFSLTGDCRLADASEERAGRSGRPRGAVEQSETGVSEKIEQASEERAGRSGRPRGAVEQSETGVSADFQHSVASPADTGITGGEYCAIYWGPELPTDQRRDDALSLCFDGAPEPDALDIVGTTRIRLRLKADQPVAQLAVRLCDVYPDGASTRITYGLLNLCHRFGHDRPQFLEPGQWFEIELKLDDIAWRVPAGNRLRIAISSAYWPMVWPSPAPVTLTIGAGTLYLPIRDTSTGDEWSFEAPQAAAPWAVETLRGPSNRRRIETDMASGEVTLHIADDFGAVRDLDHGLEAGSRMTETWKIRPDDPTTASGEAWWEQTSRRGTWETRTIARTALACTQAEFIITASLEAHEGEQLIWSRHWRETVKRGCL